MVTMATHRANTAHHDLARSVFVMRILTRMLLQTATRKWLPASADLLVRTADWEILNVSILLNTFYPNYDFLRS